MRFATISVKFVLFLYLCATRFECSPMEIIFPAYFCPAGSDGQLEQCYTVHNESIVGTQMTEYCQQKDSASRPSWYEFMVTQEQTTQVMRSFHIQNDPRYHYVWLGAHPIDCKDASLNQPIKWIQGQELHYSPKLLIAGRDDVKCCLAQGTDEPHLVWAPCDWKFLPLCEKNYHNVTRQQIADSVKVTLERIKCLGTVDINKFRKETQRLDILLAKYADMGSSNLFPMINFLFILIIIIAIIYLHYKQAQSGKSYTAEDIRQSIRLDNKAEERVSSYEDLRSEFETYSPPTCITTTVD